MTTESQTNRGRFFVTSLLPWLVAGGMLLVYLVTLNHFPSTNNIYRISELSGWYSPPRYFAPLTFLVTYPLRWLPVALIGTVLKLMTAVAGALVLALLARSVALLPHDRTLAQRQRELSESSILSIPTAWLPPLFAALVCGLQMTFWGNTTNTAASTPNLQYFSTDAFGEIFDLLLFAYCIRCLLEFRINFKISWVVRFAVVYGLGMANNWIMIAIFPGFLAALIWICGLSFFKPRFLAILTLCGLAGFILIFLFPTLTSFAHLRGFGFWQAFRYILKTDKMFMSMFPSDVLLLLSLTSLLPIFIISIRWASHFGDNSEVGIFLTTLIFHIVHGLFLLVCIWVAFDPPFSAHQKGFPLLPLFYLGAISIGYLMGYFLLVFGTKVPKARSSPHPIIQFINFLVVGFIWILAIGVPIFQVWINLPQLRAAQAGDASFTKLASLTAGFFPNHPVVVLSDDRLRLLYLQNAMGRTAGNLFLDTALLTRNPSYFPYIQKKYPEFKLSGAISNSPPVPIQLVRLMADVSKHHDIYYLHPDWGYYFERFYMQPHGLIFQLKPYGPNEWKLQTATPDQISENQKFWKSFADTELPSLRHLIDQPNHPVSSPLLRYFMDTGHLTLEPNQPAFILGAYYARTLDYWGVELEKAGLLPEAGSCFEQALQLATNSVAARVNLQFNKDLRAGKKITIEPPAAVLDKFGKRQRWTDILNLDGPFDDPSFCYVLGIAFASGEDYREGTGPARGAYFLQAIQQFDRVRTLVPDYTEVFLWLAKLFPVIGINDQSELAADQVLKTKPDHIEALFYKSAALMRPGDYGKAIEPLNHLLSLQTSNQFALFDRAISYLQISNYPAARADYEVLAQANPKAYQIDYGLQEVAYRQKDTNSLIKYLQLYLTNYYQSFPTNTPPLETEEVKLIKQRLRETQKSAP